MRVIELTAIVLNRVGLSMTSMYDRDHEGATSHLKVAHQLLGDMIIALDEQAAKLEEASGDHH